MSAQLLDIEAIDREALAEQSRGMVEAEKQCRIELASDWPRTVPLKWNVGGRHGRDTVINLEPGHSVVQPLSKAQVWCGPFAIPKEYAASTDDRVKKRLRDLWVRERTRILNQYDYPRGERGYKPDMAPTGPHRFPHFIVTVENADGTKDEPIDLHQMYKIGEWDPIKDSFKPKESVDAVRAKYEAELEERAKYYEREQAELKAKLAEMAGMIKGVTAVQATAKAGA